MVTHARANCPGAASPEKFNRYLYRRKIIRSAVPPVVCDETITHMPVDTSSDNISGISVQWKGGCWILLCNISDDLLSKSCGVKNPRRLLLYVRIAKRLLKFSSGCAIVSGFLVCRDRSEKVWWVCCVTIGNKNDDYCITCPRMRIR